MRSLLGGWRVLEGVNASMAALIHLGVVQAGVFVLARVVNRSNLGKIHNSLHSQVMNLVGAIVDTANA